MKSFQYLLSLALLAFANFAEAAPNPPNLVDGARPANQGKAPYQLTLFYNKLPLCGASLVEVDGIQIGLTAAHCISIGQSTKSSSYDIYAGDINLNDKSGLEQKRFVERVFVHPNYTDANLQNDIAILVLNSPFKVNENIKTVALPRQDQEIVHGSLTVSGWGKLILGDSSTNRDLKIAKIPIVNDAECQKAYRDYFIRVTDSMLCGGRTTENVAICNGDSGGPAVNDDGYLAGIVTFGQECGDSEYPAVFTKVSHFVNWIGDTVTRIKTSLSTN